MLPNTITIMNISILITFVVAKNGVFRGKAPKPCRERVGLKGRENPRSLEVSLRNGVGGCPAPL